MPRYKLVDGNRIQLTAEEEAIKNAQEKATAEREAKINEIANKSEESKYVQQRRNAYPEIGDQLDMLWHTIDQDPQLKSKYFDFYEAIKAVKVKYPKNG
jgi:hypothetical protein